MCQQACAMQRMRSACAAHAHAHRLRRRQIRRRACWRRARGRGRRLRCNSAVVLRFRLCGRGRVSSPPTLQTQHDVVLIAHGGWAELGSHSTCAAVVAATAGAASRAVSASMTSSGSEYVISARPPGCLRGPCEVAAGAPMPTSRFGARSLGVFQPARCSLVFGMAAAAEVMASALFVIRMMYRSYWEDSCSWRRGARHKTKVVSTKIPRPVQRQHLAVTPVAVWPASWRAALQARASS